MRAGEQSSLLIQAFHPDGGPNIADAGVYEPALLVAEALSPQQAQEIGVFVRLPPLLTFALQGSKDDAICLTADLLSGCLPCGPEVCSEVERDYKVFVLPSERRGHQTPPFISPGSTFYTC